MMEAIACGVVFSGGKRHHEIMSPHLPDGAEWIDITVPLSSVFEKYARYDDVVIFASGDPLFYGFAVTVQRMLPDCLIRVFPAFNSLQMLAHRINLPYHDMHVVSLTGRPWHMFDEALIRGERLIGVLTDKRNTPEAIICRMLRYGYSNYTATVGYCLGNESDEHIEHFDLSTMSLDDEKLCNSQPLTIESQAQQGNSLSKAEHQVNCMILQRTELRQKPFGIPEGEFHLLNGRAKMITKMPIRLLSLSMLDLNNRRCLWDVGFCTGSISIEAKLQFPHLHVTAFEVRKEGAELMELNSRKFGAPGITAVIGDFTTMDISTYEQPDAVFIGGHGGKLDAMMQKLARVLPSGGIIVMNCVTKESHDTFVSCAEETGLTLMPETLIGIDEHNPITIVKAIKK